MTTEHQIESDTHSIVPVSIKSHLCSEAMHLKLDISKAAEQGLSTAIIKRREELWLANNREAIESSNDFVEQHGLPLAKYQDF